MRQVNGQKSYLLRKTDISGRYAVHVRDGDEVIGFVIKEDTDHWLAFSGNQLIGGDISRHGAAHSVWDAYCDLTSSTKDHQ